MTQLEQNNFDDAGAVDDLAFDDAPGDAMWFETDPAVPLELKNFLRRKDAVESEARECCCSRCPAADFAQVSTGIVCFCEQLSRISAYYTLSTGADNRELRSQALNPETCGARRRFERELQNPFGGDDEN
jgi:hypothetical protein